METPEQQIERAFNLPHFDMVKSTPISEAVTSFSDGTVYGVVTREWRMMPLVSTKYLERFHVEISGTTRQDVFVDQDFPADDGGETATVFCEIMVRNISAGLVEYEDAMNEIKDANAED